MEIDAHIIVIQVSYLLIKYDILFININKEMKIIKLATVFSGIGAVEQALQKMSISHEIVFACDNGDRSINLSYEDINHFFLSNSLLTESEKQNHIANLYSKTNKPNWIKKSYFANYHIKEESWFEDVRFLNGSLFANSIDLFVGGSPCQSFSRMGKRRGLQDARGTLFYDYARLIKEIKPKAFIYENVPGMLNHDKGETWKTVIAIFRSLGYKIFCEVLNSKEYGIPQDRKRLFVVGLLDHNLNFCFPKPIPLGITMFDLLEEDVDASFYLRKKGFDFVTSNHGRAQVNESIIRTQKANQQFNWNGSFVFEPLDKIRKNVQILEKAYIGQYNGVRGVARLLTPRECLRLMGFSDNFKLVVPNAQAYRQAGNSIVVNVLEEIIKEIIKAGAFNENS